LRWLPQPAAHSREKFNSLREIAQCLEPTPIGTNPQGAKTGERARAARCRRNQQVSTARCEDNHDARSVPSANPARLFPACVNGWAELPTAAACAKRPGPEFHFHVEAGARNERLAGRLQPRWRTDLVAGNRVGSSGEQMSLSPEPLEASGSKTPPQADGDAFHPDGSNGSVRFPDYGSADYGRMRLSFLSAPGELFT
jgi:hypothetical protein